MSCDNCSFPYSLCQCVRPRNLGNFSSLPYGGVQFTCEACDVTWTGCAAAADCPECGAQFDWKDPGAAPVPQGRSSYCRVSVRVDIDGRELCMRQLPCPDHPNQCESCEFTDPDRRCPSCLRTPEERAVRKQRAGAYIRLD